MAIDALFEWSDFQDVVHAELAGLFDFAFDRDGPGRGVEILGIFRGIALVSAEFVKIVIVGDVFVGILLFGGAEGTLSEAGELRRGKRGLRRQRQIKEAFSGDGRGTNNAHGLKEFATVQVDGLGCDVGVGQMWGFANQHRVPLNLLG